MAKQHPMAQDRMTPFLSNLTKGDVTVETPDGIQMGSTDDLGAYKEGSSGGIRSYGARSGNASKLSVK